MQAKVTILIIEDEKNICDFIATTLKAQGYKAITTALGRDGISLTASQLSLIHISLSPVPDLMRRLPVQRLQPQQVSLGKRLLLKDLKWASLVKHLRRR